MKTAVVLAFDRLALRFLGCYGNTELPTPNFDRFAAAGVAFDQCFAAEATPGADVAAMLARLPARQDAGVERHAIVEADSFAARSADAFETVWSIPPGGSASADGQLRGFDGLMQAAGETLQQWRDEPAGPDRLLWLHAAGLLELGRPDGEFAAQVADVDRAFGRLLQAIERFTARRRETLVAVVAALGIDFAGELGELGDRLPEFRAVCDAAVHVPLLIRLPHAAVCERRRSFVQPSDLAATLADWFGAAEIDGFSLLPTLHETGGEGRPFAVSRSDDRAFALRTESFCLMATADATTADAAEVDAPILPDHFAGQVQLFLKPDDLWEIHNIAGQEPEAAAALLEQLRGV